MAREERDYSHRSLLDKLGVKPEHLAYVRRMGQEFEREVDRVLDKPASTRLSGTYDLIFFRVDVYEDLDEIAALRQHLAPSGGLWIFHPKGKGASPSDAEVRAVGLAAGLVDNKISAYSATHTATRYVIPVAKRATTRAKR